MAQSGRHIRHCTELFNDTVQDCNYFLIAPEPQRFFTVQLSL